MASPKTNEKRLDQAEKLLLQVLKDVRYNISDYNKRDYLDLLRAYGALQKVTLIDDWKPDKK
jgi:hypothetical protein